MALHFFNLKIHNEHNEINLYNVDEKRYKYGNLLIFACFFMYAACVAGKGVFASQMKFIADLWLYDNPERYTLASMANTYYFVAYGLVQVGLFFFMKKISMWKYMLCTIPFAAITTALIGVATRIEHIWIFFGLSGLFQAGIYSGCNLMLTRYLPVKLLSKANKIMNLGYATGSVLAYLTSALFIGMGGEAWRIPYFIFGVVYFLAIATFAVIILISKRFARINGILDKKITDSAKSEKNAALDDDNPLIVLGGKKKTIAFYAVDLITAFLITSLYYCVMNYITSLLVDVHNLSQDVSIYVSIIAPVTIAIGPLITIRACDRHKDFVRQGLLFTLILVPVSLLLALFYSSNLAVALVLSIIFVVVSNGVKSIVLSVMAFKLRKVINAGAYSAIANAVASLAAGIAPTVIGKIIDGSGWTAAYLTVFGLCVFVAAALFVIDIVVRRNYKKSHGMKPDEKLD